MTSRKSSVAWPGANHGSAWVWAFTFLVQPLAEPLVRAVFGTPRGLVAFSLIVAFYLASAIRAIRGHRRGWLGESPRTSLVCAAAFALFAVLALTMPRPLGLAALLALLLAPPTVLAYFAWRAFTAARAGRTAGHA